MHPAQRSRQHGSGTHLCEDLSDRCHSFRQQRYATLAEERVAELKSRGFAQAGLYDPEGGAAPT